jgi:hypothetical protein
MISMAASQGKLAVTVVMGFRRRALTLALERGSLDPVGFWASVTVSERGAVRRSLAASQSSSAN